MAYRDEVKQWFETGDYPTQGQFSTLFDRLRFLDDLIALADINGLTDILNSKASAAALAFKADLVDGKVPASQLPAGSSATWGAISGNITDQADLDDALGGKVDEETVGNLDELTTSVKESVVGAINETDFKISEVESMIGNLPDLQTEAKANVVFAVNELENEISTIATDNITVSIYKISNFGTL